MKYFIISILLIQALFYGCNIIPGLSSETTFEIEGYIYNNCSLEPYANKTIQLWQNYEIGLFNDYGGVLDETTTDENGYFKFTYAKENYSYYPTIQTPGGYDIMTIPWDTNIYDVKAFFTSTCNIQVSLNVINAYTADDMLTITDFTFSTPNGLKVAGPFVSGVLYTATDFPLLVSSYYGSGDEIIWWMNRYNNHYNKVNFIIDKYCNDTIYVTVDIY
ncbi:MAG: hypothetical protein WAT52_02445 [Chitinophagales bacterium]